LASLRASVAHEVREASLTEIEQLADVFGGAFERDPFNQWLRPDARRRRTQLARLLGGLTRRSLASGALAEVIDGVGLEEPGHNRLELPSLAAAALWVPPGVVVPDSHEGLRAEVIRAFERIYALQPGRPHWYLDLLAARVGGMGYGSALLRHRLIQLDIEHMPSSLWTATRANVRLYQRHGFEVTDEVKIRASLSVWWLWREAR